MIAYSDQQGAGSGGETGANLFTECCNIVNGEEDCTNFDGQVQFPKQKCDFVGMAFGKLVFVNNVCIRDVCLPPFVDICYRTDEDD